MTRLFLLAVAGSVVSMVRPTGAGAQAKAPVVRLVARNFAFTTPATMPSGLVRLRVINRGTVPHYARIVRLDEGKTLADFQAWRKTGVRPPSWYVPVGGPAPISPGDSAEAAVMLAPGRHIIFCTYPMPGGTSVHLDSGMVREVTVAKAGAVTSPNASINALDTDATLVLGEFGFSPLPPLRAGRRQFRVTNAGSLPHQALLVRLPNGVTENDELEWFRGNYSRNRPGAPAGGLLEVKPGETSWFSVWLKPGRYLFICGFVAGATRHFDKGMTRVVDVPGS
jgi:uncharacterized cupredoxin-like copper-binding protein